VAKARRTATKTVPAIVLQNENEKKEMYSLDWIEKAAL
jgi:hypothetical protein